jgi:hypothetical protein
MSSRDDDIEKMLEGDLLTIPSGNIPSGLLTRIAVIPARDRRTPD